MASRKFPAYLPWFLAAIGIALPVDLHRMDAQAWADEPVAASTQGLEPVEIGVPERIEVIPPAIKLDRARSYMHLIVSGFYPNSMEQDLTRVAEFKSTNDQVVRVDGHTVYPVANGTAELLVSVGGQTITVPVEVSRLEMPNPVSFQFETLVALSKNGCNSGACHGSPSGKGGFRLSLRAYDPVLDELTLIRETFNRRTNVLEPEQSLLLKKPLMEVAHGGGRRMTKEDVSYGILRQWIQEGLKTDAPDTATCVKVEVFPQHRVFHRPAHTQQLLVLATFSDGSTRDITPLCVFSSSDEAVATVNQSGFVQASDRGEAAILVRYLDKMETSYMMFLRDDPGFQWQAPAEKNLVDHFVFQKLQTMQILPSEVCPDEEFIRRIYLDLIGVLPTREESEQFLTNTDPDKRAKLIDTLLEREEFADFWSLKWSDLLRVNNAKVTSAGVHKFRHWIRSAIRDNMPYDQFAKALITASGSTYDNPPANYYRAAADMNDCTETTAQLFLGIRIQCAKCHNHPFERWTQDNYYGIGAFFNRVQRKASPKPDELVVYMARAGEVTQPRSGRQMAPWLPLKGDAAVPGEDDRRFAFADWLVQADNPFFAQAEVNRVWSHLIGRGIVEPVDDFRASNPPTNAELLSGLAAEFVKSGYDRKQLIRLVANSSTYQLSSRKNESNKNDEKYFSHARTRLLSAEQLLDAICQVTGVSESFPGLPAGTRATQLPSPDVNHYFLKVFGQPPREMACQCERSTESNLSQALQMINGPLVHGKLRADNNRLRALVAANKTDEEIIRELYLIALSRQPSQQEIDVAAKHLAAQTNRLDGLEDICWAVLNSKEFLFQH